LEANYIMKHINLILLGIICLFVIMNYQSGTKEQFELDPLDLGKEPIIDPKYSQSYAKDLKALQMNHNAYVSAVMTDLQTAYNNNLTKEKNDLDKRHRPERVLLHEIYASCTKTQQQDLDNALNNQHEANRTLLKRLLANQYENDKMTLQNFLNERFAFQKRLLVLKNAS